MKWLFTDSDNGITVSLKDYVAENKSKVDKLIIETLNSIEVKGSYEFNFKVALDEVSAGLHEGLEKLIKDDLYSVNFKSSEGTQMMALYKEDSIRITYDDDYNDDFRSIKKYIYDGLNWDLLDSDSRMPFVLSMMSHNWPHI